MKPGRNDPCPCGSGRKFKHCCGSAATPPAAAGAAAAAAAAVSIDSLAHLINTGRSAEAEQGATAMLLARPKDGMLWKILSVALMRQNKDALPALQHAAELLPRDAEAQANLADEWVHIGKMRRAQGHASEAEANCARALGLLPQNPDALVLLGELRADRGQFVEAHELFERALTSNPKFAPAYCSIASHRRMTRDDVPWLQGVQSLLATSLRSADETELRYALGKYFDDVGAYDEAFGSYQQANELNKRVGGAYDGDHLASLVERIMNRCDATFVRTARPEASDSEEPVFIIGMPRSGTSLAEQILASHPSVSGAGEVVFWDRAFTEPQNGLAQQYLERLHRRARGALRTTDKMPANFFYAGLIHSVFPRARIIHMRRHPLDTCLSVYFQSFFDVTPYANDLNHLAHYYGQYLHIMDHWRSVLPSHTLLEVPYEELVQDPEHWTRRMVDFIGLPWDPQCLQFHQTERAVITASRWQVRQKINTGSVGKWRSYEKYLAPLRHLAP